MMKIESHSLFGKLKSYICAFTCDTLWAYFCSVLLGLEKHKSEVIECLGCEKRQFGKESSKGYLDYLDSRLRSNKQVSVKLL